MENKTDVVVAHGSTATGPLDRHHQTCAVDLAVSGPISTLVPDVAMSSTLHKDDTETPGLSHEEGYRNQGIKLSIQREEVPSPFPAVTTSIDSSEGETGKSVSVPGGARESFCVANDTAYLEDRRFSISPSRTPRQSFSHDMALLHLINETHPIIAPIMGPQLPPTIYHPCARCAEFFVCQCGIGPLHFPPAWPIPPPVLACAPPILTHNVEFWNTVRRPLSPRHPHYPPPFSVPALPPFYGTDYQPTRKRSKIELAVPKFETSKRNHKKCRKAKQDDTKVMLPIQEIERSHLNTQNQYHELYIQPRPPQHYPLNTGVKLDAPIVTRPPPEHQALLVLPEEKRSLTLPCDKEKYTESTCFLRKHLLELFVATSFKEEELGRSKKKPSLVRNNRTFFPGKIGVRCIACKHLPFNSEDRLVGSYFFPSSLLTLYRTANRCQQEHINKCPNIKEDVKNEWARLRKQRENCRMNGGGTLCWAISARKLGLENYMRDGKPQGIFFPK